MEILAAQTVILSGGVSFFDLKQILRGNGRENGDVVIVSTTTKTSSSTFLSYRTLLCGIVSYVRPTLRSTLTDLLYLYSISMWMRSMIAI